MKDFDFNQYYQNHEVDLSWLKNLVSMDFAGAASSVVVDFVRIVRQVRV